MQLQRRLGRLEGARLRQRPAPADARQRSMRAVIERVGVPGLVAIGERVADGTTTDADRTLMDACRPLCDGLTPEQIARTCWTVEQRI